MADHEVDRAAVDADVLQLAITHRVEHGGCGAQLAALVEGFDPAACGTVGLCQEQESATAAVESLSRSRRRNPLQASRAVFMRCLWWSLHNSIVNLRVFSYVASRSDLWSGLMLDILFLAIGLSAFALMAAYASAAERL